MPDSSPATPSGARARRIDDAMERASQALRAGRSFECERLCVEALRSAHRALDYERMARVLMPLQEARRLKRQAAADAGRVKQCERPDEIKRLEPGCVLMHPPHCVGVDGRALRDRADKEEIPLIVAVREPETREGLWPIVAVGASTVRAKVQPPKRLTPQWFLRVGEELGDNALDTINPDAPASTRVNQLMDRLDATPDHELLLQALGDACRDAVREGPDRRHPKRADEDEDEALQTDPEGDED